MLNYFGLKSLLKTGDLFGRKCIYGELTRRDGKDPLDFSALMNNPSEYEVVVTNALTGAPEYYVRKLQGMRRLYRRVCRGYPNNVDVIDRRHVVYNDNLKDVFSLEREGGAFAATEPIHVGTYSIPVMIIFRVP